MSDVFISYAREDKAVVQRLHEALDKRGRNTWVDWEGIPPTAEWLAEIFQAIDAADAFAFILSPDSVASRVCKQELQHAVEQNKRLIPLVFREASTPDVPESLRKLNWIFIRETDDFAKGVDTVLEAIDTDLERVKAHTRLLVRAREWDGHRHHSLLLRSRDLEQAEHQFVAQAGLEPGPTPLQLSYITASRKRAGVIQRRILASVTLAMLIAVTLAIVAWVQRQYSDRRATAAIVRNIAPAKPVLALAQAANEMNQWFASSVPELRSSLLSALQTPAERALYQREGAWPIAAVGVTSTGIVTAALDPNYAPAEAQGALAVWDRAGKPLDDVAVGVPIDVLAGCSDEPVVLVVSKEAGTVEIRDPATGAQLQALQMQTQASDPPTPAAPPPTPSGSSYGMPSGANTRQTQQPEASSSCQGPVIAASLSANCRRIAVGRTCKTEIWSREPGSDHLQLVGAVREDSPPLSIAVNGAGTVVVRGYENGSIRRATFAKEGNAGAWGAVRSPMDVEYVHHASQRRVAVLAISTDGERIASADGRLVRLWQTKQGRAEQVGDGFAGHEDEITTLAFDPAATAFVVSGGRDNTIRVWDREGHPLGDPRVGHDSWVRSVVVSPDGGSIISSSNDGSVRLWDVSLNPAPDLSCPEPTTPGPPRVLAISADGQTSLVQVPGKSALYSQNACALEVLSRNEGAPQMVKGYDSGVPTALSRDGRFAVFVDSSRVVLRNLSTKSDDVTIPYDVGNLRALAVSAVGNSLAVALAGNDGVASLWRGDGDAPRAFEKGHRLPIVSLAFDPAGQVVASGGEDNEIQLWDAETGKAMGKPLQGHKGWVSALAFSADGHFVSSGSWDKTVRLWERVGDAGEPMGQPFRGHDKWITQVRFDPQNSKLISYGDDGKVGVWQGGNSSDWMRASCQQLARWMSLSSPVGGTNSIHEEASAVCGNLPESK